MMSVDARLLTADEVLQLPDDGSRYELVDGELKKMSPSGAENSRIAILIAASLLNHVARHHLGAVYGADGGFVLRRGPDTMRSPDVSFVSAERYVKTAKFFPGAPDLAVEVISPSDSAPEISFKTSQYLRTGVRAVVIVDPEHRMVYVHRPSDTDMVTEIVKDVLAVDDVVPGWKMPLSEIFEA